MKSLLVLAACTHASSPAPVENRADPKLVSGVAALTPDELPGVRLGMTTTELLRVRPNAHRVDEGYTIRDDYSEVIGVHGVEAATYYVMKGVNGVLYQITLSYRSPEMGMAVWNTYLPRGKRILDLGGDEIVVREKFPYEVRIWTNGERIQWMAVIKGTEWWDNYHPNGTP